MPYEGNPGIATCSGIPHQLIDIYTPYAGASGMLIHINENSDGKIEIISFVVKFHSSPVLIANSCV
jgi:hypothetical protein